MSNKKGNRKLLVIDCLIIVGIIVCIAFAVYSYDHEDKTTYNIVQTFTNNTTHQEVIIVDYNFTASVLSAQNNIDVEARGYFGPEFIASHPFTKDVSQLYAYFPAYNSKSTYDKGHLVSDPIVLKKISDNVYFGKGNLTFAQEGDKCPIVSYIAVQEVNTNCKSSDVPIIHISSADSLFQLKTAKITLSLSFVFLAFTIILIRDFIKDVAQNIALFKRPKNDTDVKPTEK